MAIAHVQTVSANGSGLTSLTTASITTTTGHLVVLGTAVDRADSSPTPSDSNSNSWSNNPSNGLTYSGGSFLCRQDYAVLTTGGSGHTFTYTTSNFAQSEVMFASEFSGNASPTSSVFDQNAAGANTFVTSHTSGVTGTRTQASEGLVSHFNGPDAAQSSITAGSGFTIPTNGTFLGSASIPGGAAEFQIVSVTGTDAGTFTTGSSSDSGVIIGTYKATAAADTLMGQAVM